MGKLIMTCCLLFWGLCLHAQQENIWIFGNGAGLDFNNGSPLPIAVSMPIELDEGCANVCDANGQLLFITDGYTVLDRNYNIMPNGNGLITDIPLPPNIMGSTSQGALIVPMPGNPQKYYVFSLTPEDLFQYRGRLYYSVVDMNSNGGMGDVEPAQKGILLDTLLTEHMRSVVGDDCNIWLVVASLQSPAFKSFEINSAGLSNTPVISNYGSSSVVGVGRMCISPNRKKLSIGREFALELYDFNPATGAVSNPMILDASEGSYGICFSPDNSKLYVNAGFSSLAQYDLSSGTAAGIIASKYILDPNRPLIDIKLGPDGKIYYTSEPGIGRIDAPDLYGAACMFNSSAITLVPGTLAAGRGFPNVISLVKPDTMYTVRQKKAPCYGYNHLLQANDNSGWGYVWSNGTASPETTVQQPGTYWVNYHTAPCIFHSDTFQVSVDYVLPQLTAFAGCKGASNAIITASVFPGDTVTHSYTWRYNNQVIKGPLFTNQGDTLQGITSGTYTLQIIAGNNCDTTLSIVVPDPDYEASFSMSDSIICMGNEVSFLNMSQGGFTTFHWDFGDGLNSLLEHPEHLYSREGVYTVRFIAGSAYPCYDTIYKTITVDAALPGNFLTDRDSICTGQNIVFTPVTDSTITSLHWQLGDGTSRNTPNAPSQHAYDQEGTLTVQLRTHFRACPDTTFSKPVYVFPLPLVNLGPDSGLCLNGAFITLQNLQPAPAGKYDHLWSTGDTSSSIRVVHPGTFNLTVRAEPLGCSTTENIVVHKDCYTDIPNVFTPNGDGINDYFFPRQLLSKKISKFSMQIFNRWGQVIFSTDKTGGRGWDGKYNSKDQPQGVYVYQIAMELDGHVPERYEGNVTLIR